MAAPYSHIACCYDGSAASEAAVAEARRLLADGGGRLSVIHVHHDPPIYGGMYQPDLGAVRLVVAGIHHGAARRTVLGSVTNHLVQHAPCPVLIVRVEDDGS